MSSGPLWQRQYRLQVQLDNSLKKPHQEMKNCPEEAQTLHAGCSKVESKIFAPPQTPFMEAQDSQNLIRWRRSLPLTTNPVWWGSMHAISSYCGNRPTHTPTHRQDWLQYTAPQLVHSIKVWELFSPKIWKLGNSARKLTAKQVKFWVSSTELFSTKILQCWYHCTSRWWDHILKSAQSYGALTMQKIKHYWKGFNTASQECFHNWSPCHTRSDSTNWDYGYWKKDETELTWSRYTRWSKACHRCHGPTSSFVS